MLRHGGVADAFERLKQQGLFRAAGMTAAGDTSAVLEVIASRRSTPPKSITTRSIRVPRGVVPAGWNGGQDFCGVLAAGFHQNMGVLNIEVLAGGVLASPDPPDRLFVMTSNTDLANELRCAAAVRRALPEDEKPAEGALRFVLGNRDFASRVIEIGTITHWMPR